MPIRRILHGLIVVAAACAGADAAGAAELKVLTAGAFKPVVAALAPVFEGQTGHTVRIENDTAGALARPLAGLALQCAQNLQHGDIDAQMQWPVPCGRVAARRRH